LLLVASYFFYGWWDWRFLILLFGLSLSNYLLGLTIERFTTEWKRSLGLISGITINLGVLIIFKYYSFFVQGFIALISLFGYELSYETTRLILPLGISFYTFLSLSYIIDIYRGTIKAHKNIYEVLLSLSFFPIILAGPIQRPSTLIPQIANPRTFNYTNASNGVRQILWGLFAKVVIADNLAPQVNEIFTNSGTYSGSTLAIGALLFSVQIYTDFSGYSNMAIGIGKLLGFNLMQNFAHPYFSRDLPEFWKRWHISLTTWFRDYLFMSISLSISWRLKKGKIFLLRKDHFIYISASSITWLLTGLWHGASYNFIIWGLLNGTILIIYHLQRNPRKVLLKRFKLSNNNKFVVLIETFLTFSFIVLAWIFFRTSQPAEACQYISNMFSKSLFAYPEIFSKRMQFLVIDFVVYILSILFFIIEWKGRDREFALTNLNLEIRKRYRWSLYAGLILSIIALAGNQQKFIYFQF